MDADEPNLYALTLVPRIARPGETVRLLFSTRNLAAEAAEAFLRFVVPAGLEPLDEPVVALGRVQPGAILRATLALRVAAAASVPLDAAYAVLELGSRRFATNRVALAVCGRAIVDGAASVVRIAALDADRVRVDAVVVNEGDGVVRELALVVPPPAGTRVLDSAPTRCEIALLEPGARVELGYDARIVAPVAALRVDDAFVLLADGTRYALRAEGIVVPAPLVRAPEVVPQFARRTVELAIVVYNDGWADAYDVPLALRWPAGVREIPGTLRVDDAEPLRRTRGDPVVLPHVPAQGCTRLAVRASMPPGTCGGTIAVQAGDCAVTVPFERPTVEDVRLRFLAPPATLTAGEPLRVAVEVHNAGDLPVRPHVVVDAPWELVALDELGPKPLASGTRATVGLTVVLRRDDDDGTELPLVARCAGELETASAVETRLIVRNRPWLALDDLPRRDGDEARYVVRHVGTTPAHGVTARLGDDAHAIGSLLPGERATVRGAAQAARCGGVVLIGDRIALRLPPLDGTPPVQATLALDAPSEVFAGAPFVVALACTVDGPVDTLTLRASDVPGLRYVAGSTLLDGVPVLDRDEASPLAGGGLVLRAVAGPTTLQVRCAFVAATSAAALPFSVSAMLDGDEAAVARLALDVRAYDGYADRSTIHPYQLEACTLPLAVTDAAPVATALPIAVVACDEPTVAPPYVLTCTFDDERRELLARALRTAGRNGLAAHVLALRALFPDGDGSGDPDVTLALRVAGDALADTYDRLYVKLRIPGFEAAADDLEDGPLRAALDVCCRRLLEAAPAEPLDDRPSVRIARDDVLAARDALASEPYGAPAIVRFLLALVPEAGDDALFTAALRRWKAAARDAVHAASERGPRAYDDALARGSIDVLLDDARAALIAALRAQVVGAGAVA